MKLYGFEVHEGNKLASLYLMEDVGKGNGVVNSRWGKTFIKTGKKNEIIRECGELNTKLAEA